MCCGFIDRVMVSDFICIIISYGTQDTKITKNNKWGSYIYGGKPEKHKILPENGKTFPFSKGKKICMYAENRIREGYQRPKNEAT